MLAGLIVFWAVALDDGDPSAAESPSSTTSSAATSAEESSESGSGSTSESPDEPSSSEQTSESSADGDPLSADNIETFLTDYHAQVLTDPRAAYARTGPTLQANISEDNYVAYWEQFSDVRLSDIQASDGNNVATATMQLVYTDGSDETAQHTLHVRRAGRPADPRQRLPELTRNGGVREGTPPFVDLAVAVGFEPTEGVALTRFRGVLLRPLGHATAEETTGRAGPGRTHVAAWRTPPRGPRR